MFSNIIYLPYVALKHYMLNKQDISFPLSFPILFSRTPNSRFQIPSHKWKTKQKHIFMEISLRLTVLSFLA